MPPDNDDGVFDEFRREQYLECLRAGVGRMEAAEIVEVSNNTVLRRRKADPLFEEAVQDALERASEDVEKVLRELSLAGDLQAMKEYLKANRPEKFGDRTRIEVDATPAALEMSRNEAIGKIAELRATLESRRAQMALEDGFVDVESEEL